MTKTKNQNELLKSLDDNFYKIAISERNLAWVKVEHLELKIKVLQNMIFKLLNPCECDDDCSCLANTEEAALKLLRDYEYDK